MSGSLGNKEVMAKNIKRFMEQKGITRRDLCDILNFKYSTVTDWLNAEKYPRIDKIELMANYFGVNKADLVEPEASLPRHGVKIPILGRVIAGLPAYANQEIIGYDEITEERARTGEYFALIVRGDSMEPLFYEGDHVIIERQPDVDNGEIAIVGVDGDDATIKRIRKVDGGIILQPENRAYEPMFFSNKDIIERPVTIYGKVVEQRRTKF